MRTEVKLSKRLERIASFVQPGSRVADIGTDHGYVPIWLVQKGVCRRHWRWMCGKARWSGRKNTWKRWGFPGKLNCACQTDWQN